MMSEAAIIRKNDRITIWDGGIHSLPSSQYFILAGAAQIANSVHAILIMPLIIIASNNNWLGEEGDQKYHS